MASAKRDASTDRVHFNPTESSVAKMPDFSKWTKEQIGFAPYWTPEEGKWFVGVITDKDERDPEMIRLQVQALLDTPAQRGPNYRGDTEKQNADERHEKVVVSAGDYFSISVYKGLEERFDEYMHMPFPVPIRVTANKKGKTKTGNEFWHFTLEVPNETKQKLTEYRQAKRLEASASDWPELEK